MPIYEYECKSCGESFELRRGMNDSDDEIKCPRCGTQGPKRVFSVCGSASSGSGSEVPGNSCVPRGGFT